MDLNLIKSLIGNLGFDFSKYVGRDVNNSSSKQKNMAKNGSIQLVINGNITYNADRLGEELANRTDDGMKKGFHAVFLTNGQVYFGKLEKIRQQRFVKLTNVFYLNEIKINEISLDFGDSRLGEEYRRLQEDPMLRISLVKLGDELHTPVDEMNINVDQILFWERLKDTGFVVQSILRYESEQVDKSPNLS